MNRKLWIDLWWLMVFVFVGAVLCVGLSFAYMNWVDYISALHLTQWTQNLLMLVLPTLFWVHYYKKESVRKTLQLSWPGWRVMVLVAMMMVAGLPALDGLSTCCAQIPLPDSIAQWAEESAQQQEAVIRQLISGDTVMCWVELIALMCLMTAVGEEWLFRGALVRCFVVQSSTDNRQRTTDNGRGRFWTALWVGLIFSAIHMDVYGLLPRWLLGSVFCYLVFWTRSIWPSVLAHALNNLWALIEAKTASGEEAAMAAMAGNEWEWYYVAPSVMAVAMLLWLIYREGGKHAIASVGVRADERV